MEAGSKTIGGIPGRGLLYYIKRDRSLYIMLIPVLTGFILFKYIPIINNVLLSFQKYDIMLGTFKSKFVGFEYYKQLFEDPFFARLIRNTFILGFYTLIFSFPAPILFSLLLNELQGGRYKKITQSISYLPHFVSTVVIVAITYKLFSVNGVVNTVLQNYGMSKITFIGDSKWFRTLYVGTELWQDMGWSSIIYLAAIAGISHEIYEAAFVDGANRFQRLWYITLPSIMPTMSILFILKTGKVLNVGFEKVFLMYSPSIFDVADVLQTYVYRRGIIGMDYSFGSVVSVFNGIISLTLIIFTNFISKKVSENGLF